MQSTEFYHIGLIYTPLNKNQGEFRERNTLKTTVCFLLKKIFLSLMRLLNEFSVGFFP